MENNISYDRIIEMVEMAFLSLAIFSLAIIKLLSFCDKKKTNKEQLDLLRAQAEFNNRIEVGNQRYDISAYNKNNGIVSYIPSYTSQSESSSSTNSV